MFGSTHSSHDKRLRNAAKEARSSWGGGGAAGCVVMGEDMASSSDQRGAQRSVVRALHDARSGAPACVETPTRSANLARRMDAGARTRSFVAIGTGRSSRASMERLARSSPRRAISIRGPRFRGWGRGASSWPKVSPTSTKQSNFQSQSRDGCREQVAPLSSAMQNVSRFVSDHDSSPRGPRATRGSVGR